MLGSEVVEGVERPLDPRSITVRRIAGAITSAAIGVGTLGALVIRLIASRPTRTEVMLLLLAWLATVAAIAAFSWLWPPHRFRHSAWRIDASGMRIRAGVFWRSIVSIPHARVQHTDVRQGPVERAFGLATLVVHTAGTENASIELAGIAHETALAIRDHLIDEHN